MSASCEICGHKAAKYRIIFGFGAVCSEDCAQIAKGKVNAYHDELRNEPLSQMPDALDTADFERWALKLSVHLLAHSKFGPGIKEANPFLASPDTLSLELKDRILRHIPKCYVSETEERGHMRMFHSAIYCFRQPVPKAVIYSAAKKAEILQ